MVKVSQLYRFVTVVETGSINKAADRLYISQPTLSTSLKELENEIGKPLLKRSEKGVTLTKDGETLYVYAQSVLKELKQIEGLKESTEPRQARLSVSIYSMLTRVNVYEKLVNTMSVESGMLNLKDVIFEEMVNDVNQGNADVGLGVISTLELAMLQTAAASMKLTVQVIDSCPLYLHMGPRSKMAESGMITSDMVRESAFLHLPFDTYSIMRRNVSVKGVLLADIKRDYIISNYPLLTGLLSRLDAFMLGNSWQIPEIEALGGKSVKISENDDEMHLVVLTKGSLKSRSQEAELFIKIIEEEYAKKKK